MPLFVTCAKESITDGRRTETCWRELIRADEITPLLERLDGKTRSELILDGPDGTSMTIGGGDRRRYVVSIAVNRDEIFFELLRSDADEGDASGAAVRLVTGGAPGIFDARCVVDFPTAARAARAFAATGKPDPALRWKAS